MAMHEDKIFVRGDDVERLSCESCHMPLASRTAASAPPGTFGDLGGRAGDTRTHLFSVNAANADYSTMFTAGGEQVDKDGEGTAAVTLDFVCLRCHNGQGSAFAMGLGAASTIADGVHD